MNSRTILPHGRHVGQSFDFVGFHDTCRQLMTTRQYKIRVDNLLRHDNTACWVTTHSPYNWVNRHANCIPHGLHVDRGQLSRTISSMTLFFKQHTSRHYLHNYIHYYSTSLHVTKYHSGATWGCLYQPLMDCAYLSVTRSALFHSVVGRLSRVQSRHVNIYSIIHINENQNNSNMRWDDG